jgi:hypothetical protein
MLKNNFQLTEFDRQDIAIIYLVYNAEFTRREAVGVERFVIYSGSKFCQMIASTEIGELAFNVTA